MNTIIFADEPKTGINVLSQVFKNEAKLYHLFMDLANHWNLPASRQVFQEMAEEELGPCDILTYYKTDPAICERFPVLPAEHVLQMPQIPLQYDADDPVDWLNRLISKIKRISQFYKKISKLCGDQELKEFHEQMVLLKDRHSTLLYTIRNRFLSCPSLMLDLVAV